MCLNSVDLITYERPKRAELRAWKAFERTPQGRLRPVHADHVNFVVGRWILDPRRRGRIPTPGLKSYRSGFHAFIDRAVAAHVASFWKLRVVRQVRIRRIVAEGIDGGGGRAVVGQEILIVRRGRER